MNKLVISLLLGLCFAMVSGSLIDEGLVQRKIIKDTRSLEQAMPRSAPTSTVARPPPPAPIRAPPPPGGSIAIPAPNQVTNRQALYNLPIPLAPGETLTYTPSNTFSVTGGPPGDGPRVVNALEGDAPLPAEVPTVIQSISAIGPALNQIPGPLRQSFVNLITPAVKTGVPSIVQAAQNSGVQTQPQGGYGSSGTPPQRPPPPPSSGATTSVSIILVSIVAAIFLSL